METRRGVNDAAYMIRKLDARVRQLEAKVSRLLNDRPERAETYPGQGERCETDEQRRA